MFDELKKRAYKFFTGRSSELATNDSQVAATIQGIDNVVNEIENTKGKFVSIINEINQMKGVADYFPTTLPAGDYEDALEDLKEYVRSIGTTLQSDVDAAKGFANAKMPEMLAATFGMAAAKTGEGLLSVVEDITDAGAAVVGGFSSIINHREWAKACENFIKSEWSHDVFNFYYNSDLAKKSFFTEDSALAGAFKIAGKTAGILYGAGAFAGATGLSGVSAGTGLLHTSGTTWASTMFAGTMGLGSGTERGIRSGKSVDEALVTTGLKDAGIQAGLAFAGGKLGERAAYKSLNKSGLDKDIKTAEETYSKAMEEAKGMTDKAARKAAEKTAKEALNKSYDDILGNSGLGNYSNGTRVGGRGVQGYSDPISNAGVRAGETARNTFKNTAATVFGAKEATKTDVTPDSNGDLKAKQDAFNKAKQDLDKASEDLAKNQSDSFEYMDAHNKYQAAQTKYTEAEKALKVAEEAAKSSKNSLPQAAANAVKSIPSAAKGAVTSIPSTVAKTVATHGGRAAVAEAAYSVTNGVNPNNAQPNLNISQATPDGNISITSNPNVEITSSTGGNQNDTGNTSTSTGSGGGYHGGGDGGSSGGGNSGGSPSYTDTTPSNITPSETTPTTTTPTTNPDTTNSTVDPISSVEPSNEEIAKDEVLNPTTSDNSTETTDTSTTTPTDNSSSTTQNTTQNTTPEPTTTTPVEQQPVASTASQETFSAPSSTGYTGGSYSEDTGYISSNEENGLETMTDIDLSTADDTSILEDTKDSIEDIIQRGRTTKIPTSSVPIQPTVKSTGNGVIPIAAGLSAAAAAGIGAKAYIDHKNNSSYDDIDTEEWSEDDSLLENDESSENENEELSSEDEYSYQEETEKYGARNNEELADLQ